MRHPTTSHAAFTLLELICTIAVLAIAAIVILPFFAKTKSHPPRFKCINNLKNIGLAYRIWATDNNENFPFQLSTNQGGTRELPSDIVFQLQTLSNELSTPKILVCPVSPKESATNWTTLSKSNISYFIGICAAQSNPYSILGGDEGFSLNGALATNPLIRITSKDKPEYPKQFHTGGDGAVILFADGSVQTIKNKEWPALLKRDPTFTNVFLLP